MFQRGEVTSTSPTLQIYKPFQPFPLPSWLAAHTIILNTSNANRVKSIEISCLQYDQLWVVMKDST